MRSARAALADAIIKAIVRRFRFLVLILGALVMSACRLDVKVNVAMNADGTGEVVVVATVDADVVNQVPGLAGSLRLDDAIAAGWAVEGPSSVEDGGLTVTLRHPFASAPEAANLVNSLGPPFQGIVLDRVATEDDITTTLTGALTLPAGFDSFGDANLLAATGATPFRAQLDAAGAKPAKSMGIEFTLAIPGDVEQSSGDDVEGGVRWNATLDGGSTDLNTRVVLGGESGNGWAGPVATIALILLAAWLVIGGYLGYRVWTAQHRRRRRPTTRYR